MWRDSLPCDSSSKESDGSLSATRQRGRLGNLAEREAVLLEAGRSRGTHFLSLLRCKVILDYLAPHDKGTARGR